MTMKVVTTRIDKNLIIRSLVKQLAVQKSNGAHGNGAGIHVRIN